MECYNYPSYIPGLIFRHSLFFASCFYQSIFQWNPIGFMPFTIGKYMVPWIASCGNASTGCILYAILGIWRLLVLCTIKSSFFSENSVTRLDRKSEILRAQMMLALCTLLSPLRSGGLTVEEKHTNTPEVETSQAFRRRNKNKQHGCKIWAPEDYSYQWSHI